MFGHTGGREKLAAGFPGVVCVHSHKVFAGIAESVNVAILHIIQGHLRHTPFNSFPANDCPVMFLRGAVLKDKTTGKNLLPLKFINSGTQTIKSAYAAIDFIDDAGDIKANGTTIQAEYLDVNCASGGYFRSKTVA